MSGEGVRGEGCRLPQMAVRSQIQVAVRLQVKQNQGAAARAHMEGCIGASVIWLRPDRSVGRNAKHEDIVLAQVEQRFHRPARCVAIQEKEYRLAPCRHTRARRAAATRAEDSER